MDVDGAQAYAALVSNPMAQRSQLPNDSGATTSTVVAETLNGKHGKARKPYTITKQRERWSEEEHLRFIEALRLHGRAWRKIEEHIGTKTAVQIRSHAQKFFNKLEKKKEAGEAPDKEENFTIPPPRPKRKPAKPYPRKDGVTSSGYTASVSPGRGGETGGMGDGSDRGLVEATGTTDGTHISANAQLRGSDGDSACSRETDNQDTPGVAMDASWQSKLLRPTLQQHEMACNSPSAAAARSLAGLQASGFDPSQLQWGMGRCYEGSAPGMNLAAAGLSGLQGLSAAQALALLCTPLYAAAAERQYQHQSVLEAAAAAAAAGHAGGMAAAAARSGGGVAAASGDRGAAGRSKSSRRAAPSVNSGSTGPPLGAKRALEAAGDEEGMPAKKAVRESSDTGEEGEGMEVTPSSPSIQEKELKAASQPSNTNGNTSGSNESDASKRRQGTAQGEGSNPTNGNSSGNGYSVKDSNTGTNTGTNGHTNGNGHGYSCGNGTSAFHPAGWKQVEHSSAPLFAL
ncbi:hypothetical protein OEZ86_001786 [Tetradesmus obliquus]|nr:hypothetical protein OEZ86_001786 [Tetradesmus obliquus]